MTAKHKAIRLGLTGGVGSGKTTAAGVLRELGACVVDADAISHALTAPNGAALDAIRARFGDAVFLDDGSLDRAKLADIVFADPAERRALEAILHPAVQKRLLEEVDAADEAGEKVCVLDVPLLFETGFDVVCDEVWVMTVGQEQQVLRMMNRDQITREQALMRIGSQMPLEEKERRADRVISTDRPPRDVRGELERLYKELIRRK